MSRPGAFLGVGCAGSWDRRRTNYVDPEALLPLPVAVPIHANHTELRSGTVGVGAAVGSRWSASSSTPSSRLEP
jgi:hypothetical protein